MHFPYFSMSLALPAERQQSFSNAELSVKIVGGGVNFRSTSVTFIIFFGMGVSLGLHKSHIER